MNLFLFFILGLTVAAASEISINNGGGLCLDVHKPDMHESGGKVQVWVCNGEPQQQWKVEGDTLVNGGGLCLDVHKPDMHKSGGKVQVWVCNGKPQQQWKVEGDTLVNVGGPRDVWSKISQFFVTPNNIAEFDKHRNEAKMWFERFLWPDVRRMLNQENVPYGTVDEAFNRLVDALYEPLYLNADSVLHLHNSLSPSTRIRTRTRNLANEEFTYCDALIADTIKGGLEVLFSVMGLIRGPAQRLAHDLYKSFVEMIGKQDMKMLALLFLQADRKALTAGILTTVISKINFSMLFKEIDGLVLTGDLAIAIAIDIFVQVIRFIANPVYAIALSLGLALIALVDVIATVEEYTEGCCNNECSENKICEAGQCISPGFPRFTLSWYGDGECMY